MSKGVIVQHLGDARYLVSQKFAVEKIQQELDEVEDRIAELAIKVPEQKLKLIQAQSAVQAKSEEIDALIPNLIDGVEGTTEKIAALQIELIKLQADARKVQLLVSELITEDLSLKKRQGQLKAVKPSKAVEVWCADYTEDLSGDVGLIDVNDEGGGTLVIQPGFEGSAEYSVARDGAIFPDLAQSARQIFFNAAVLPGVQKWLPRYRVGTILNVDEDICSVELDEAKSSAQDLPINERSTLNDVPIMYMDCNGAAFEEDDRVIVRFTQSGPLVVGFESEPRQCDLDVYVMDESIGIMRMSADMRTIKEFVAPSGGALREFAVTQEKLLIVYEELSTYQKDPDGENLTYLNSRIVFQNSGAEISNVYSEPTLRIRQVVGANSENFLIELNDGGAGESYAEVYDLDGNYIKAVNMTAPNLDNAVYSEYNLPGNDDFVLYANSELSTGFSGISLTSLFNGSRINYLGGRSNSNRASSVTKNRIYIADFNLTSVEIRDAAGVYIGAWDISDIDPAWLRAITVTKSKGYAFVYRGPELPDYDGYSVVAVYERAGDTFTFSHAVDLRATHGFELVPKAMPDMNKLLKLDA